MSLIIAKIFDNHIRIESDSRILFNKYSEGHFLGRVKAIIATPAITICSAGKVFFFERVIARVKEVQKEDNLTIELLLDIILEENVASNDETSFLLCTTRPKNEVIKIENGAIERYLINGWIGDKKGLEKFQWHFIPVSRSGLVTRLGISYIMWESFKRVIEDENLDSVGDLQVSIVSEEGIFRYTGMGMSVPRMKSIDENIKNGIYPLEDVPLRLSAKNGDYEVKFLPSRDGFSFGLYYPFGNFGVFIKPYLNNAFSVLANCSLNEFLDLVETMFQSQLVRRE